MPPLRSGPVNRRQQTVRVVTKREGASERIDYLVDLWSCIIDIRDNDVIPVAVCYASRIISGTRAGFRKKSDSAVGVLDPP